MNNNNLDIFISTHKDFQQIVTNPCYKIITGPDNEIKTSLEIVRDCDTELFPREFSYAEGSRLFYLWKNYPLKKYIGLCHYRSYFQFPSLDDIPEMDDLFKKYKIITVSKLNLGQSVASQYKYCHIIDTLFEIGDIITEKYPNLSVPFENFLNQNYLYPRNMFIMKSEDFKKYCEFVFDIMLEFDRRNNLVTTEDVRNFVDGKPNVNNILYQSRLEGFLLERLTSFYIMYNYTSLDILEFNMKLTNDVPDWNKKNQEDEKERQLKEEKENIKTCILLTGCVNPNGMSHTKLQDSETRKQQYIDAINFYLENTDSNIVFVENSECDFSNQFKKYIDEGRFEYHTFNGNDYDKKLGKGYGESRIIKYASEHSKIFNDCRYVIKITGRLKVKNIKNILELKVLKEKEDIFICDFRENDFLWSMVFIINTNILKEIISKNGQKINDFKHMYFEDVLYNSVLSRHNITVLPFLESPEIDGVCGTNGKLYSETIEENTKNNRNYKSKLDENLYQIAKFYIKAQRSKDYERVKYYITKKSLKE